MVCYIPKSDEKLFSACTCIRLQEAMCLGYIDGLNVYTRKANFILIIEKNN